MQERRGETPYISSSDEVGVLFEWFLLLTKSDIQTQSEMENIHVHTPSQRVQKLRQSVTQPVPCIAAKLWCESHIFLSIWCRIFQDMIWGWKESDIWEILSYGATKRKALVTPWGYRARLGKYEQLGKIDMCKNMNDWWE